jgi:hypothetical protein
MTGLASSFSTSSALAGGKSLLTSHCRDLPADDLSTCVALVERNNLSLLTIPTVRMQQA